MRLAALLLVLGLAGCAVPASPPEDAPGPTERALACPDPCEVGIDTGPLRVFEPTVAASPDGRVLLAAAEEWTGGARWVHAYVSTDGGGSWAKSRLPGGPSAGSSHPLAACALTFDPLAAVLEDGTLLAGGVGLTPAPNFAYRALFVARSTDQGSSWETVVVPQDAGAPACTAAHGGDPLGNFVDKPFISAGAGSSAIVSWAQSGDEPAFARTDDGGRTWVRLPPIDDAGAPEGKYSAAVALADDGTVYTVYGKPGDGQFLDGAYVSRFADGAWRTTLAAKGANAYPQIALDDASGRIYVAFPKGGNGGGAKQPPMLTWSDDGGLTWSAPVALDEPTANGWTMPTLAVDDEGVAWSGFFHYLGGDRNEYRVAAFDGDAAHAPVVVSRTPVGHQDLSLSLGHYMGMAALPSGGYAVWVSGQAPLTDLQGAPVRLE